jgi:chemotaxis signal transduction protein
MSDHVDSVLIVIADQNEIAIPFEQVVHLDNPGSVTPLPFSTSPIEGLAQFNHRPLLQIHLAAALHLTVATTPAEDSKVVVLATPQGDIGVRVDRVVGFRSAGDFHAAPCQVLRVETLLPWLSGGALQKIAPTIADTSRQRKQLSVLNVAAGDDIISLLTDSIDRIEDIDAIAPCGTNGAWVIRVGTQLLPAYSLAKLLGQSATEPAATQAVIVSNPQGAWALMVSRVLGLEKIDTWHALPCLIDASHSTKPTADLWYLNQDGQIKKLLDANQLIGLAAQTVVPSDIQTHGHKSRSLLADNLSCEGLRIACGGVIVVIPVGLSRQVLGDLGSQSGLKTADRTRHNQIPWLDGRPLLTGKPPSALPHCHVQISLGPRRCVVLAVDKIALQPSLTDNQWMPLTTLAPATAVFFDAAAYDETHYQWMLRVRADMTWKKLTRRIAEAGLTATVADALQGWLNGRQLAER